jgi:Flp pilus assembly protein protease CpaA
MTDTPQEPALPPSLRFLKWLVIVLMITMIAGVITIVGLLVTRMPDGQAAFTLPDNLVLPAGAEPEALTMGKGWIAVVTRDGRILIFTPDGKMIQEIAVTTEAASE